jgi:hypothetical protein
MLLAKKADPIENLAGSRARCLESSAKFGVFQLEPLDALRRELRSASRSINGFHARLGLECTPPKTAQLFAKVTNEPL